MSGFSVAWLGLREAADQRARDRGLLEKVRRHLMRCEAGGEPATVVDLGAGTGASFRAIHAGSAEFNPAQLWRLVDNDEVLLNEARQRLGSAITLDIRHSDLNRLTAETFERADLVTASALFDLVSAEFIQTFARLITIKGAGNPACFYAALNYDGTTRWSPAHPLDEAILSAFNRDQVRDKGFGPALGPAAIDFMEQSFNKLGFTVELANSAWELGQDDHELMSALISGIVEAVSLDPGLDAGELQDWVAFRLGHAQQGGCRVGHVDLLAWLDTPG